MLGSIPLTVATAGLWAWSDADAEERREDAVISVESPDDIEANRTAPIVGGVVTLTVLVGGVALMVTSSPPPRGSGA